MKPAAPTSIVVGSEKKSKARTFIQNFRRSEYAGQDPQIEMGSLLGWLRLTQGSGDGWRETTLLSGSDELKQLSFDELFLYLTGCLAFLEQLRFDSKEIGEDLNGLERLRISFQANNTLESVVRTVAFLLSGSGDAIERA